MTMTKRYGAVSFLRSPTGHISPRTMTEANSIAGAIARAAQLRRALIERLTPRIGTVAFELVEDTDNNTRTVTLSKFGEVPHDSEIYEAVMELVGLAGEAPERTGNDDERPVAAKPVEAVNRLKIVAGMAEGCDDRK